MASESFRSVFSEVWDVVVFGGGYTGFAAAMSLHTAGKRVLLVDRAATPLWESAWAFSSAVGRSESAEGRQFFGDLQRRGGAGETWVDGAIAQVVASHLLREARCPTLFYATPVAVDRDDDGSVSSVTIAAKSELRVLTARQWIDTTEAGELYALLAEKGWTPPAPDRQILRIFLRETETDRAPTTVELQFDAAPGACLRLEPSGWNNERALTIDLPGVMPLARLTWIPALQAAHAQFGDELRQAVVTHGSVVPMPVYASSVTPPIVAPNVIPAMPWFADSTLAGRFESGRAAAARLSQFQESAPAEAQSIASIPVIARELCADVIVAGIGTGGVMAAVAAARNGAKTVAFDPLPFAGGIGTGGGIHAYYFGVKGGLQEELDHRTRAIMPLFGASAQQSGFHPDAKKIVLDQMLAEAGVTCLNGATLFGVEVDDAGRIRSATVSTENGPMRMVGTAWIDGTGDADLAAAAGAQFELGRTHDGQLHAFSQSSGRANLRSDLPKVNIINYDAGFVDPTDAQDLTRGRLLGTAHYLQAQYTAIERPTYIAPALGLRQGRQVITDYVITLADIIERRTFDDAIGLTGCHYDNHATDYEFESDEAMFWVWCCRQWRSGRTGGQMPYRMMLPMGLENLWVACRGAGVSAEAHHSLRMQRDLQRLGEASGIAAAMTAREADGKSRKVDLRRLQNALITSGALADGDLGDDDPFGKAATAQSCKAAPQELDQWIAETHAGPCAAMYRLMRHGEHNADVRRTLREWLDEMDAGRSFRAASLLALWADASSEKRLCLAIVDREYGFEDAPPDQRPETSNRLTPHWVVAVGLLRICGTPVCLPDLAALAADPTLPHNARTSIAITIQSVATRHQLSAADKELVIALLRQLLDTPVPNTVGHMQRRFIEPIRVNSSAATDRQPPAEDFAWQLHLAVAKAEQAVGTAVHVAAASFLADQRATVRKAFTRVLQTY